MRGRVIAKLLVVALFALSMSTVADAPAAETGLELVRVEQRSARLSQLTLHSPALERDTRVRVLTPEGFDPARDHLPVLWLLHGGFGSYRDWTDVGDAEAITAGLPLIVVMPDGGQGGWYSDWLVNTAATGPQRWETHHIRELVPFVHEHFRTRTDRAGNAIAGLSMGGFGAAHYAARHPDLFGFVAAFSGAVDILHPGVGLVTDASPLIMGGVPTDIWGDRLLHQSRWRANNPVDLAANLRTLEVQIRTGNGMPGGRNGGGPDVIEIGVSQASATLHRRLDDLLVPHLYDAYGPGAHSWPYWQDALRATLPGVLATAAEARPAPERVDHVAFEPRFSVWGFDVDLDRASYERSLLSVRPGGFTLQSSGRGTVTTPAWFAPGEAVEARIDGRVRDLVAGTDGRVAVPVALGPAATVTVELT